MNRDLPRKPPDRTLGVILVVGTAAVLVVITELAVTRNLLNGSAGTWAIGRQMPKALADQMAGKVTYVTL
jgi:hypothetical protein